MLAAVAFWAACCGDTVRRAPLSSGGVRRRRRVELTFPSTVPSAQFASEVSSGLWLNAPLGCSSQQSRCTRRSTSADSPSPHTARHPLALPSLPPHHAPPLPSRHQRRRLALGHPRLAPWRASRRRARDRQLGGAGPGRRVCEGGSERGLGGRDHARCGRSGARRQPGTSVNVSLDVRSGHGARAAVTVPSYAWSTGTDSSRLASAARLVPRRDPPADLLLDQAQPRRPFAASVARLPGRQGGPGARERVRRPVEQRRQPGQCGSGCSSCWSVGLAVELALECSCRAEIPRLACSVCERLPSMTGKWGGPTGRQGRPPPPHQLAPHRQHTALDDAQTQHGPSHLSSQVGQAARQGHHAVRPGWRDLGHRDVELARQPLVACAWNSLRQAPVAMR